MLVNLELNKRKLKKYNERMRELDKAHPDCGFSVIKRLESVFCAYDIFMKDESWSNYIHIEKDYRNDFNGVYVSELNSNHSIEPLTDYVEVTNFESPLYWLDYGVADNASQVLDYYDILRSTYSDFMHDRKFVILMTPIFRDIQPVQGGWRWHKWGQYIGKFEPEYEYLHDEQGIDYVWVFHIYEVKLSEREG